MSSLKSPFAVFGILVAGLTLIFSSSKPAQASTLLRQTFEAQASTGIVGTIRHVRVDPENGNVYVLGTDTETLGLLSPDGSTFTGINYDFPLSVYSGADMVASSSQIFLVTNAGSSNNMIHHYIVSGGTAAFVANNTLSLGSSAIALNRDTGTIYTTKSNTLALFDTDLNLTTPSSTLSTSASRLAVGNNSLFFLSTSGRFTKVELDGTETAIATGGPTSAAVKGLSASSDGSALYYASNTLIGKRLTTGGDPLWTYAISNVAGMDLNPRTGIITVINTSGIVTSYYPIHPVETVSISASGSSAVLSWDADISDSDFDGVTIRRSTSSFPTSATDGTAVTSSSLTTSFTDTGLDEGTYYYSFFNETSDGYYSTAATSTVTIDLPPEAPVLTTETSGSTISLSWSVPADTARFVLRRSTSAFPSNQTEGTAVTTTDSGVTNLMQAGMEDGTYYYSLFAADVGGNYSSAGTSTATINTTPPSAPSSFAAAASGDSITLSWSNPVDADFSASTIRRSSIDFPTSTTDGAAVTSTIGTSYTDSSLADGTYYYSIFSSDTFGNLSVRATATATVNTYVPAATPTPSGGGGGSLFLSPSSFNLTPFTFLGSNEPITSSPVNNPPPGTLFPPISLEATQSTTPIIPQKTAPPTFFTRVLRQGDRGSDVKALQVFLNSRGFIVSKNGNGSPGRETTFFGPATAQAVKKYQEANKETILKPYNLEKGTGIVGPKMIGVINKMK